MNLKGLLLCGAMVSAVCSMPASTPEELKAPLAAVRGVGGEGKGNVEAADA